MRNCNSLSAWDVRQELGPVVLCGAVMPVENHIGQMMYQTKTDFEKRLAHAILTLPNKTHLRDIRSI